MEKIFKNTLVFITTWFVLGGIFVFAITAKFVIEIGGRFASSCQALLKGRHLHKMLNIR